MKHNAKNLLLVFLFGWFLACPVLPAFAQSSQDIPEPNKFQRSQLDEDPANRKEKANKIPEELRGLDFSEDPDQEERQAMEELFLKPEEKEKTFSEIASELQLFTGGSSPSENEETESGRISLLPILFGGAIVLCTFLLFYILYSRYKHHIKQQR